MTTDIDELDIAWDAVEVLGKNCPPGGLEAQTLLYGWFAMRYFCTGRSLGEIPGITMISPLLAYALGAEKENEDNIYPMDKLIELLKREMSGDKMFLIPLMSGGHWALLVVDKLHEDVRYYDSLCGDPDRNKIGTEDEIKNLPEKCLAMAERLLGVMSSLSLISPAMLERPPLMRANPRVRQPWASNQCGHFVLAYCEQEARSSENFIPLFFVSSSCFPGGHAASRTWACSMWVAIISCS